MLTDNDYKKAADLLGLQSAHLKAIKEIESSGSGFLSTGEPKILFERHVFYKFYKEKYGLLKANEQVSKYPNIINSKSGDYGKESEQHSRLQKAANLDRELALQSASWGLFQIMGYHWKTLNYSSLQEFINCMYKSEYEQLLSLVRFLKSNPYLISSLKKNDFTSFAKGYNGPLYYKNNYDTKLKNAYLKYS